MIASKAPGRAGRLLVVAVALGGCGNESRPSPAGDAATHLAQSAQSAQAASPAPPPPADAARAPDARARLVLHAARALVPRTGAVIAPAWVLVEGDRIASVGAAEPPDAQPATELGDATILPGLIDAHTHLLHLETAGESASMIAEATTMSDADRALRGSTFARQMLAAGFTTVRDLGNAGRAGDLALKRAIARGWVLGPTMVVSSRAFAPPGGQFPRLNAASQSVIEQEYVTIRTVDDARGAARQAFYEGADLIKLIVDSGGGRDLTGDEIRAVVELAHGAGKKVAAHVLSEKAAETAVAAGVDSCEHAYAISDATLARMAQRGTFLVPTDYPLPFYDRLVPSEPGPDREEVLEAVKKQRAGAIDRLKRAKKARVRIAAGSDAYQTSERGTEAPLIFRAYAEAGMTPLEIVQAATSNAADLLGLPANATSLGRGSPADLVAVRGDPTKDVEALYRVALVVKGGRVVSPASP